MSKNDNVKKLKKPSFIDFLKAFTKYLTNKNRNTDQIIQLIEKHKVDKSFLFNRLISYNYNKPHIIFYINKYLNNKFEFYYYDIYEYLLNVTFIMDQNNQQKLFFLKSQDFKDPNKYKVKKLLKDYYLTVKRKYLNDDELNYLYSLFCQKIITPEEIEDLNKLLNGPESKLNLDLDVLNSYSEDEENKKETINEYIEYCRTRTLPEPIVEFCESLKSQKPNRKNCQKCPLFDRDMVVLDTNREDLGPVDLMFIALNPGRDERLYNKPLTGNAGKLHREKMFQLDKNVTWLITNVMLCSTNNQKDIGKNDKQILNVCQNCREFLDHIIKNFPAKVYIPIGKQAMQVFNVNGSVTQNSGKPIKNSNSTVTIPMIHPSAVLQSRNINTPIYNNTWEVIFQIASKLGKKNKPSTQDMHQEIKSEQVKEIPQEIPNQYNLAPGKMINFVDETLTYFDSVNLDDEKILNIYIDQEGEKRYKLEDFSVPVYIKNCNLQNRTMLSDQFDYVTYINGKTRYRLAKTLKDNLLKHKNMAITIRS